jgi:hypothetical protein
MRERVVQLGSSQALVRFPATLDPWFDQLEAKPGGGASAAKRVELRANGDPGRYDVLPSVDGPVLGLELGEALATFWERVSFLLVDDLREAMVLHAAALRDGNGVVIIPGRSGFGKQRSATGTAS